MTSKLGPRVDKGEDNRGPFKAIYSALWRDYDFRELHPEVKLVLLYLRTCPACNLNCIFDIALETIERDTGLTTGAITAAITILIDTHWIAYREGIVWIKKGLKFEPLISLSFPKHRAGVINALKAFPKNHPLIKDFIEFYKLDDTHANGYRYPLDTHTPSETETETETETERLSVEQSSTVSVDKSPKEKIPYQEIVAYLNEKTGKDFKTTTKETRALIRARWNSGFSLEAFKKVIDIKTAQWKTDQGMAQFLRPQTLFGTKFEAYLNEHAKESRWKE